MDCPNDCKTELIGVYAYSNKRVYKARGGSRYARMDYMYCMTCDAMFKMKLEPADSRPRD